MLGLNSVADMYVKGLGIFDMQKINVDENLISLCIPFKKVECREVDQYIEDACKLFKDKHPESDHSYSEISLTLNYRNAKTNADILIAVIDDILEETEIYSIPLNNEDIFNKKAKGLFKRMILKELNRVLSL